MMRKVDVFRQANRTGEILNWIYGDKHTGTTGLLLRKPALESVYLFCDACGRRLYGIDGGWHRCMYPTSIPRTGLRIYNDAVEYSMPKLFGVCFIYHDISVIYRVPNIVGILYPDGSGDGGTASESLLIANSPTPGRRGG